MKTKKSKQFWLPFWFFLLKRYSFLKLLNSMIKIFSTLVATSLLLVSCSSASTPALKGTGKYPNSVYVSTVSKDIWTMFFGSSSSPVQLKIFSDFQCPACISFHKNIEEKLWKDYISSGKVGVTFLNYPLTFSTASGRPLHVNAEWDALAALCAGSFGKYSEYRHALYDLEDSKRWATITNDERIARAKQLGMDADMFGACLTQAWYQKALEKEITQGNALGVQGTPSVFINNSQANFKSSEEFFKILDALGQKQ